MFFLHFTPRQLHLIPPYQKEASVSHTPFSHCPILFLFNATLNMCSPSQPRRRRYQLEGRSEGHPNATVPAPRTPPSSHTSPFLPCLPPCFVALTQSWIHTSTHPARRGQSVHWHIDPGAAGPCLTDTSGTVAEEFVVLSIDIWRHEGSLVLKDGFGSTSGWFFFLQASFYYSGGCIERTGIPMLSVPVMRRPIGCPFTNFRCVRFPK